MGGGESSDIRLSVQVPAGLRERGDRFRRSPHTLKPGSIIPTLVHSVKPALWRRFGGTGFERRRRRRGKRGRQAVTRK